MANANVPPPDRQRCMIQRYTPRRRIKFCAPKSVTKARAAGRPADGDVDELKARNAATFRREGAVFQPTRCELKKRRKGWSRRGNEAEVPRSASSRRRLRFLKTPFR